jgi:hypothetical protein
VSDIKVRIVVNTEHWFSRYTIKSYLIITLKDCWRMIKFLTINELLEGVKYKQVKYLLQEEENKIKLFELDLKEEEVIKEVLIQAQEKLNKCRYVLEDIKKGKYYDYESE